MNIPATHVPFSLPKEDDVETLFVEATIRRLREWLSQARPGFCARLDDLSIGLMKRVAKELYEEYNTRRTDGDQPIANVRLLVENSPTAAWECEWTEAVRLRNPSEQGRKRAPLLLLVPPGTPLLGSLDADTFKVISCDSILHDILASHLKDLPPALEPLIPLIKQSRATDMAKVHYLLAVAANRYTPDAAGRALCVLGLWPHEGWLATGEQREYWLTSNKEVVSSLRGGNTSLFTRVYDLNLKSADTMARLYALLSSSSSVEEAAKQATINPAWEDLDFGRWDPASHPESVVIDVDSLGLEEREDGYQVLKLREQPYLALSWSTNPSPVHVQELTHFLVELIPSSANEFAKEDSEQTEQPSAYQSEAIAPGKSARKTFRLKDLRSMVKEGVLSEGLYRARVTAWAKATNITGQRPSDDPSRPETNISDYFWIEWDKDVVEPQPVRKDRRVANYLEARREVQWDRLNQKNDPWSLPAATCSWDNAVDGRSVQATCNLQFGRQNFHIRLSNLLRHMEIQILGRPEQLGAYAANLTYGMAARDVSLTARSDMPQLPTNDPFLSARSDLFSKIRGADNLGLVETADLLGLRDKITAYAREYIKLLGDAEQDVAQNPKQWPDRVGLATMDTIRVRLPGLSDETSIAILLAPVHPLQLLWGLQLALLGEMWLKEAWRRGEPKALSSALKQALQGGLQPGNMPPVLFDARRIGYLNSGLVESGWGVYLPASIIDKQSALSRLSRALSGTMRAVGPSTKSADVRDRIVRYLKQHPYVSELQINVFNPGDAGLVVDLLNSLDAERPELRYQIRLFSTEDVREDLGSALDRLVNPEVTVNIAETAEKYSQASAYPLHPNLRYSKHCISDFLEHPNHFSAHVSLLLDLFHPDIAVAAPFPNPRAANLFGLVQDDTLCILGKQGQRAWERQVIPIATQEIEPGAVEANLLSQVLGAMQEFIAALGASPSERKGRLPTVRLDLTVEGQNLLYEIHRISDWVITIDRHLGIDYFDSAVDPSQTGTPAILLDFAPEFPSSDHALLMLTTQVGAEIEELVAPPLQRLGLETPGSGRRIVEYLRSLSGRLAMRLMTAPMASQGVIGMALARAFLGQLGLLEDAIVIPVDAHIELLRKGSNAEMAQNRTDLIVARRVGTGRQIELALVEVKCTAGLLTPAGYGSLREEIETQIGQTQAALAELFDPLQHSPDLLERPLRNRQFSNLLQFYVNRARRYGLLSADSERSFLDLLESLGEGYTVAFRQLGLIFELGRDDDVEEASGSLVIYRIGRHSSDRLIQGDEQPASAPPTWDRLRTAIRGTSTWTRPRTEHGQVDGGATRPEAKPEPVDTSTDDGSSKVRSTEEPGLREAEFSDSYVQNSASSPAEGREPLNVTSPQPAELSCSYLVGDSKLTPQWGILGKLGTDVVGIDLNGCNTISIFGVQGAGKSYTMGSILEMAVRAMPGINVLPKPLAAVVFHYNESQDYPPEFVSMARPNSVSVEVARLREDFKSNPAPLNDILLLTPEAKISERMREFPDIAVEPIAFDSNELTIQDWRFLMGAVGNDSLYIKELNLIMRSLRDRITIEALRQGIQTSHLSQAQQKLAILRLQFAEQFVRDGKHLRDKLYPGRLVIVDLRDELIEKDEALGLFVVMLRVFAGATHAGVPFSKLVAFDEAHKYIRDTDLLDSVVDVIRQMRHQATSVLIASQDPPSLPLKVVELSSLVMLHRMDSPGWLKHIQRAITALGDLSAPAMARLRPGEAFLWARLATDPMFTHRAIKVQCRPRVTQHGGATKTANEG